MYEAGQSDVRPWGGYIVTAALYDGDVCVECRKEITVNPLSILSLQSHDGRSEVWTVAQGEASVVLDGVLVVLTEGQSVSIPLGAIHTVFNAKDILLVFNEIQMGDCREDDIHRYWDVGGRAVENDSRPVVLSSIKLCKELTQS